jgi:hypothetical protein
MQEQLVRTRILQTLFYAVHRNKFPLIFKRAIGLGRHGRITGDIFPRKSSALFSGVVGNVLPRCSCATSGASRSLRWPSRRLRRWSGQGDCWCWRHGKPAEQFFAVSP